MKNLENCLNPIKWPQNAKKKVEWTMEELLPRSLRIVL